MLKPVMRETLSEDARKEQAVETSPHEKGLAQRLINVNHLTLAARDGSRQSTW